MNQIIFDLMNQYGYLGVFLLIAIENIFPPIPSEIILTFGGFMTTYTELSIVGVIIASTIGSILGAVVLYLLGRILNVERLEKLFESKLGKILHLKKEDVRSAEKWFLKHGNKAVFFCRFVPIVRSLISIPAGMAKMKPLIFFILTTIGTTIWNTVLVLLGRAAGDAWEQIVNYVDVYKLIAIVIIVFIALVVAFIFVKHRFLNKNQENQK